MIFVNVFGRHLNFFLQPLSPTPHRFTAAVHACILRAYIERPNLTDYARAGT